ncbi:Pex24p-domain-containing protein [Eremomyces bilateralis CBS 781.70]|uniref:Pex24p-domain-containing protein n=1 Tax=Eremomyces bilateralis CBS 781.70 TaxID=1392243 RepID=A0A6G1G4L1_9PEZI|nr:Pex24p-domain-containing protein [Eremomyces bilateralis CBS 781.70]KAF1812881.1 Pex24p-domain-containing protein [Eremomyces bilateralis CBS 781.70]
MPNTTQDASTPSTGDPNPPTFAAFSPNPLGHGALKQRSTILVHQKSPLLVATPPQITRALAYAYPFLSPLNRAAALLSWTSPDPWESFLLLAAFWAITLYGDHILRWAGPIVLITGLIFGMYLRRYSPLSTGYTGAKGQGSRARSDSDTRHHKSLDEILDTLNIFTSRCNILLDPFLRLTDFLSTQRTATSATTRPALTTLFIRLLLITPIWFGLTLPPLYIITTKRIILSVGTVALSWHSRPARISRVILWRSRLIRRTCTALTGLHFSNPEPSPKTTQPTAANSTKSTKKTANDVAASLLLKRDPAAPSIRFTFALYENQRRWLGIGWTSSMLAYERAAWTDEHLNSAPNKDRFELPEVDGGHAEWRWVDPEWRVEMSSEVSPRRRRGEKVDDEEEKEGWIYYDNKWRDPRRGRDSWGRYTRRRKWCRDAELVEITPAPTPTSGTKHSRTPSAQATYSSISTSLAELPGSSPSSSTLVNSTQFPSTDGAGAGSMTGASVGGSTGSLGAAGNSHSTPDATKRKGWFRRTSRAASEKTGSTGSAHGTGTGTGSSERREREEEDEAVPMGRKTVEQPGDWGYGEDVRMALG